MTDDPGESAVLGIEIDTTTAHPARVYDYWLGGKTNLGADRTAAEQSIAANPDSVPAVRANRAFLGRAVRELVAAGVDQFLDVGTGIPTEGNTHEVAQAAAPRARVVYVDNDPIVLAHAHTLLKGTPQGRTAYISGDLRRSDAFLRAAADIGADRVAASMRRYNERAAVAATPRSHSAVTRFFDGLELLEPGVVQLPQWRPDPDTRSTGPLPMWCGAGRKR